MKNKVPEGWGWSTLGEVCSKPQYGWTSKAFHEGSIRYLRTTDISKGTVEWKNVPFCEIPNKDIEKYKLYKGDILVSRAGSVGLSFLIERDVPFDTVFASYLIRFRPNKANTKYIAYFLKSPNYWKAISEASAGIAVQNVNASKLSNISIPLPPLPEQKRIVKRLDALMEKVDSVRERLDAVPQLLKSFRQSVLSAAVSGRLTADWREKHPDVESKSFIINSHKNIITDKSTDYILYDLPNTWEWYRIIDIADVKGGKRLPKGHSLVNNNTGFPYIKAGNLKNGTVITDDIQFLLPSTQEKIKRYIVNNGDVYLTNVGACIGDAGIIPPNLDGANLTENALKICNFKNVINQYLSIWLQSPKAQKFIKSTIMSGAQGKLALGRVQAFPIPIPPLEEQKVILMQVEVLFELADVIEARYEKAKVKVNGLPQALLAKAFRGEMVKQEVSSKAAIIEEV